MLLLILGLIIFLGVHSLGIFAEDWRRRQILHFGAAGWKGRFALVSLVGFVMIIVGFGEARVTPVLIYAPSDWLRHLNILWTLIASVLVAAAYTPGNRIKARIGHPMLAGVAIWAFGHLLAVGTLSDVVLFGAFLVWALVDFVVSSLRDRRDGTVYPPGSRQGDITAITVGVVVWIAFAIWLHRWLIGVNPLA
ncbi:MAG TPA: NnrU family protein [Acidocella sp.]|jgi:uncharacterized membrane protein|uniref:NnrU family protein n=1 Tax=Acidocella sp. TaxID=50710 RepID=UPI002BEC93B8|nr:NnrU family protein [Acidocella sp.]HVE21539.1 NnrU family protein [Acidocella sp.]